MGTSRSWSSQTSVVAVVCALGVLALQCTPRRPVVRPINPWGGWTNEPEPYEVVRYATPNPFESPGCKLVVEDIDYDRLRVGNKSVTEYEAGKKGTAAGSFAEDLDEASRDFVDSIKERYPELFEPGGDPANTFIMRPRMTRWEPGFSVGAAPRGINPSRDSEMNIVVDVVGPGGDVLDEIVVSGAAVAHQGGLVDGTLVTTGGATLRMHELAARMGKNVGKYIKERWSCRAP